MSLNTGLFQSARQDWETPHQLFRALDREFAFDLDVCATRENHKCRRFLTPAHDSLHAKWTGRCWMNPPYGRQIGAWVRKARLEAHRGAMVVCLLPARTDTAWWQDHVMRAREIRLLRGRVTFVGASSPAPFPSAIVIFGRGILAGSQVIGWTWKAKGHGNA